MERRNRRMVSLGEMTRRFTEQHKEDSFRESLLTHGVSGIFGEAIGAWIGSAQLDGTRLILEVTQESKRKELRKHKRQLLRRAKEIYPYLTEVVL